MPKFQVINDVRLSIFVEAEDANHAVRQARDTSLDEWQIGDEDEIEVYDEDGNDADEWDWETVETLLMEAAHGGRQAS